MSTSIGAGSAVGVFPPGVTGDAVGSPAAGARGSCQSNTQRRNNGFDLIWIMQTKRERERLKPVVEDL